MSKTLNDLSGKNGNQNKNVENKSTEYNDRKLYDTDNLTLRGFDHEKAREIAKQFNKK